MELKFLAQQGPKCAKERVILDIDPERPCPLPPPPDPHGMSTFTYIPSQRERGSLACARRCSLPLTVFSVLEGRRKLFGSDPGKTSFLLSFVGCGCSCIRLGSGMGRPAGERDGKGVSQSVYLPINSPGMPGWSAFGPGSSTWGVEVVRCSQHLTWGIELI